jgi:hypothetical protein
VAYVRSRVRHRREEAHAPHGTAGLT